MKPPVRLAFAAVLAFTSFSFAQQPQAAEEAIDWPRAQALHQRARRGEQLAPDDAAYLERARAARAKQGRTNSVPKVPEGLVPLCDLDAEGRYQGEDGGLYGSGRNTPPDAHRRAAQAALAQVRPLGPDGSPAADGKVVLVALSMSNATQEFSTFKRLADAAPEKSPQLIIVDCAQGGQAMAEWAPPEAAPWTEAKRRLTAAGVTPAQVQVAWVKLANKGPRGSLAEHGRKLERDTEALLQNARTLFPNLQIAYLGSRIYGGYATTMLNPEPYAYESAFAARWLIQRQVQGDAALNSDPARGPVETPLLLWGPYLWADGTKGRKLGDLIWERSDFGADGTHPSDTGRKKVANLLLNYFANDPLAKPWFGGAAQ